MKCAIETSDRGSQAYCLLCFADIHRTRKDSIRARPRYESAGALMVEIGDRYGEVKVMVGKAKVDLKSKNYAAVSFKYFMVFVKVRLLSPYECSSELYYTIVCLFRLWNCTKEL